MQFLITNFMHGAFPIAAEIAGRVAPCQRAELAAGSIGRHCACVPGDLFFKNVDTPTHRTRSILAAITQT
jgi:hypothetical protein